MKNRAERIGILTGGGDCPGLNAVIRAASKRAFQLGWEVLGIKEGFNGLLEKHKVTRIDPKDIQEILPIGGSILGTNNRSNPFQQKVKTQEGWKIIDCSPQVIQHFHELKLKALVVVGGDGTLGIAYKLYQRGLPIVGIPKTIDNDVEATVITFGFDTAVSTATEALDKLHTTARSHRRVMVTEVMGRYCGWIALHSGISGGADIILIPEIPFDIHKVCEAVKERYRRKQNFCIVVVAEGARPQGGSFFVKKKEADQPEVLGGIGEWVAREIEKKTGRETRHLVLGHLQRGGSPTTFDRLLGTRFGVAAVDLIRQGEFGKMVALDPPHIKSVPLKKAIARLKSVPRNSDVIAAARALGISFGDG